MNSHDNKLTLQETEQLCRLYMECQLSVLEEKELQYVLGKLPYQSPVIDEVRRIMAVEVSPGVERRDEFKTRRPRLQWLKWSVVAACAAVAVVIAMRVKSPGLSGGDDLYGSEITVFVDGRRLSGEAALETAVETRAMCMARLEETVNNAYDVQSESLRMLNQKQNNR